MRSSPSLRCCVLLAVAALLVATSNFFFANALGVVEEVQESSNERSPSILVKRNLQNQPSASAPQPRAMIYGYISADFANYDIPNVVVTPPAKGSTWDRSCRQECEKRNGTCNGFVLLFDRTSKKSKCVLKSALVDASQVTVNPAAPPGKTTRRTYFSYDSVKLMNPASVDAFQAQTSLDNTNSSTLQTIQTFIKARKALTFNLSNHNSAVFSLAEANRTGYLKQTFPPSVVKPRTQSPLQKILYYDPNSAYFTIRRMARVSITFHEVHRDKGNPVIQLGEVRYLLIANSLQTVLILPPMTYEFDAVAGDFFQLYTNKPPNPDKLASFSMTILSVPLKTI